MQTNLFLSHWRSLTLGTALDILSQVFCGVSNPAYLFVKYTNLQEFFSRDSAQLEARLISAEFCKYRKAVAYNTAVTVSPPTDLKVLKKLQRTFL